MFNIFVRHKTTACPSLYNSVMMRLFFQLLLVLSFVPAFAQEPLPQTAIDTSFFSKVDSLYREDQFYFGVTYNRLLNKPKDFDQNGFSTGLTAGFLRDMPINKNRTLAFAAGLGVSYNKYHQNLLVTEAAGDRNYEVIDENTYSRNKMEQVFIDLPIEFRWRNSTPESHKFWRVYTGFKIRYLVLSKTKYEGQGSTITVLKNEDFNKIQYGPYIAFGFNTWNFQAYYGVNPLFKSAETATEKINLRTLNLGLMFYIL